MPTPLQTFQALPLRAHALLADAPLRDLRVVRLRGGGPGRTMLDVAELLPGGRTPRVNPVVTALFRLRWALGKLFGWDRESPSVPESSYIHRLTDDDRRRSLRAPGTPSSPFRVVYFFEDEALHEIINRTAHAFSLMALTPADDGYLVYWAVYVKKVGWLTPLYMAVIDPFRRFIVYPSVVRSLERRWAQQYG